MCSVQDIRECLTPEQTPRFRDYQISRFIESCKSWRSDANKTVVLKAINAQANNEQRTIQVIQNPVLFNRVMAELDKGMCCGTGGGEVGYASFPFLLRGRGGASQTRKIP